MLSFQCLVQADIHFSYVMLYKAQLTPICKKTVAKSTTLSLLRVILIAEKLGMFFFQRNKFLVKVSLPYILGHMFHFQQPLSGQRSQQDPENVKAKPVQIPVVNATVYMYMLFSITAASSKHLQNFTRNNISLCRNDLQILQN